MTCSHVQHASVLVAEFLVADLALKVSLLLQLSFFVNITQMVESLSVRKVADERIEQFLV